MIPKAKAYLSKASAYGGGNSDEGGNLPSLPVLGFPLTRASRPLACQRAGARDRKKILPDSIAQRALGLPLENACVNFLFFKPLLTPPLLQVTKGIKETSIISHCHLFSLVLIYSTSLTSFFRFLPGRSSLWAPVRGRLARWNRMAGAESSHGVLGPVVKVTRLRQRWS